MSNFLAPATVSAALQRLLTPAVSAAVPGAEVWVDRSDVKRQKSGVGVYLYRTSVDAVRRNDELPTRTAGGTPRVRPRIATSLHYLLTFHGKDDEMVPQRLLGATLARLHARPVVTDELVDAVTAEATQPQGMHAFLALNDLADAEERVRISPDPMSLDELSKLWSVFFQSPYQLSATYLASSVLLEETLEQPVPAPPVLTPRLTVRALLRPTVTGAYPADDPRAPVVADSVLRVVGSGLRGDRTRTRVRVGPAELEPDDAGSTATALLVDLAGAALSPGLHPVVVVHRWLVGEGADPRGGETSNVVGVQVVPRITASVAAGRITVVSDLPVGPRQRAGVSLLDPATGRVAAVLDVPEREAETGTLSVDQPATGVGLPAGPYGVRLDVDGAPSPVTLDADGGVTAPVVTIP